jgi:hypothetical protein
MPLQCAEGLYDHVDSGRLTAAPLAIHSKNDALRWGEVGDAARERFCKAGVAQAVIDEMLFRPISGQPQPVIFVTV